MMKGLGVTAARVRLRGGGSKRSVLDIIMMMKTIFML